jgi:PAS domain S-box-containing protein
MSKGRIKNPRGDVAKGIALFATYLVTARFGLSMGAVSGFATLVWPPTGIALFAFLKFGYRLWPGVFAGALSANLLNGAPLLVATGIAVGNTSQALLATFLLRRTKFDQSLNRVRDVGALLFFGALVSTTVSASIGMGSLWAGGVISILDAVATWKAWWLGDALGVLVVAPLLFVFANRPALSLQQSRMAEAVLMFAILMGLVLVVFGDFLPRASESPLEWPYFIFPGLFWAALRFTQPGAVTAIFMLAVVSIASTALGHGPFVKPTLSESLVFVQIFMAASAMTALTLAAAVSERDRAREASEAGLKTSKFLAQASATLASSLDYETTLQAVARLVVPMLGDNCVVDVLDADGTVRRVAEAATTPEQESLLRKLRRFPPHPSRKSPVFEVLKSGKTLFIPNFDSTALQSITAGDEYTDIVRQIAPRSSVTVPLLARGEVLGTMTFGMAESGRNHSAADVHLAEELGRRAGVAIDNALLFRAQVRASAEARQNKAQLEAVLQSMSDGIVVLDMAGKVLLVNEAEARINGFAGAYDMKRHISSFAEVYELAYPDGRTVPVEDWPASRVLRGEPVVECELRGRRKDTGQEWHFAFSGAPVRDEHGKQVLALVITRDITDRKRADERIQISERKFAAMFESAPFAICLVKMPQTVIADVNPAFVELFGFSKDEAIGKTSVQLGMHPDIEAPKRVMEEFQHRGFVRNVEMQVATKGGKVLVVANSIDLIELDGETYALTTLQDVTTQKQAEESLRQSERHFRFLADNLPQIVWTADLNGQIDYYNERWYEFTGFERGQFGIESWRSFLHPDDVQSTLEAWRHSVETGQPYQREYRLLGRNTGGYRWFLGRGLPLKDELGRINKWFGTATDIHAQKEHAQQLSEALRIREDFLAIAGHELKTPLAALLMHVQSLQRAQSTGIPIAKLQERLAKASNSGLRLESLIDQMLDVSRITAGRLRLELEPFELEGLLKEVIDRFAEQAQRVGSQISLRTKTHACGVWDRLRIDQVLSNLVANAVKYGQGKPIDVELCEEGGQAVVRITDRGIGIDPSQQKKIFERFERAVGTREFGGFGLGLWISHQITEASGGSINVESAAGQGSVFTLRLPLQPREGQHVLQ